MAGIAIADYTPSNKIFTYQGRLYDNGAPADGEYDLVFCLLADPDTNIPDLVTWPEVYHKHPVSDGYFTVDLNFAAEVPFTNDDLFDGSDRWLSISIRPSELKDPNDYTFIYPLTKLNAVPFAHLAHRLQTPAVLRSDTNEPLLTIANEGAGPEINFEGDSTLIKYGNDATIDILDDYFVNIGDSMTQFIGFDSTENIGNDRTITIDRNESKTVGVNSQTIIAGERTLSIGAADETNVGGVSTISTGGDMNRTAGQDLNLEAGRNINLLADGLVRLQRDVYVSNDHNDLLKVEGAISMQPMGPQPPLTDGYGKLFVDRLDDKLYFLDSNGNLYDLTAVKESRVSFSVKRNTPYNWPTSSTFETIDFSSDTTIWDNTGNGFKDKNSVFVAPADGLYTFHGVICFMSMVKGDLISAAISVAGRRYRGDMKTASGDTESVRVDITVYLGKDQEVILEGYVSTATPPVDVYGTISSTEAFTYFNGAKVD
jgi:hypothetical protein